MSQNLSDLLLRDITLQPGLLDRARFILGLYIQGVEVTQAIQYYNSAAHLTDAADRMPDNSVTLVAGKPAWVRVYVRSWLADQTNVTGTVEVMRRTVFPLYSTVGTLTPQPPGAVTARTNPSYATERSTITDTLNFIVPADWMCGPMRLVVRVHNADNSQQRELTVDLDVTLQQTLRLAGIMVGYNGPSSSAPNAPNLTLAAPTVADLQTTSGWTLLTFPVSSTATYRSAGMITWTLPLTDPPSCSGCCTPNWLALNAAVQAQKVADGNRTDVLYYGLMAGGIPMGPVIGCNTGGVSTGANQNGVTMAHELGHACGLPHAPCNTPGDPNYPAYEPYDPAGTPQASIGEYGLDISTGAVMSPALFKDMMSYCGPRWISLYNYGRLTNNTNLDPVRVCVPDPWWRDIVAYDPLLILEKWLPDPPPDPFKSRQVMRQEPVISIIGTVHSEKEVEIKSVMRLEAVPEVRNARATGMTAELVGASGRVVASGRVHNLRSYASGGGCDCDDEKESRYPYTFQAFISNVEPGAALRIRNGEEGVWERRAPAAEPKVAGFKVSLSRAAAKKGAKGAPSGPQLLAQWETRAESDRELECWLQWSDDNGRNWYAMATGMRGKDIAASGEVSLDVSALPSGSLKVRMLASDGFHTAVSDVVAVELPKRPPDVSILSPRDGQTLMAGGPMRLLGAVTSPGGPAAETSVRWLVDDKPVEATGLDAFITAPAAGKHRLTLSVNVGGSKADQTVAFKTVKVGSERDEKRPS